MFLFQPTACALGGRSVVPAAAPGAERLAALPPLQGCKVMIAIERARLELGKPEIDSAYWN